MVHRAASERDTAASPRRMQARPAFRGVLTEYVDFYLSADSLNALVEEAGYVPLSEDRQSETIGRWEARTTGAAG